MDGRRNYTLLQLFLPNPIPEFRLAANSANASTLVPQDTKHSHRSGGARKEFGGAGRVVA
jgi:hypothetical protein